MLPGVFPRFFSQIRDGARIHARWTFSDGSGAFAKTAGHNSLSMTRNTTGVYDLLLTGGCREMVLESIKVVPATPGTRANVRETVPDMPSAAAGTCRFRVWTPATEAVASALSDPQSGTVLEVVLWVGK
jgi:hypothetical protein